MSYTSTNWQTGDTITAEKLNNMESGIENANEPFVVTVTNLIPDKSYAEIVAAFEASKEVRLVYNSRVYFLSSVTASDVSFSYLDQSQSYVPFARIDSGGHFYAVSRSFMLSADGAADNGKGLVVKNGAWAKGFPQPFIVTLTPTEQDFSGTMDKTPQEITAAYNDGREIRFVIPSLGTAFNAFEFVTSGTNVQAGSVLTYRTGSEHLLIECLTSPATDDATYMTHIYSLTPMS